MIRFWNLLPIHFPAYHFIKCVYVGLLCMIICFQERTVHLLWESEKADCIYLMLAGANLPFLMYSSFLYGEIPSFAAASAGFYSLLKYLRQPQSTRRTFYAVSAVLGITLSVMLRMNNLILLIAALLVILLEWLRDRRHGLLVLGLACTVCSLTVLPLVQKSYELRAGRELRSGATALSFLAMGMQESTRANGWHNGFDFITYQNAGLDSDLANEVSRQAIAERLQTFKEHPDYAARFFLQKHLSQWADGTYASRQATLATFGAEVISSTHCMKVPSAAFLSVTAMLTRIFCIWALRHASSGCGGVGARKASHLHCTCTLVLSRSWAAFCSIFSGRQTHATFSRTACCCFPTPPAESRQ